MPLGQFSETLNVVVVLLIVFTSLFLRSRGLWGSSCCQHKVMDLIPIVGIVDLHIYGNKHFLASGYEIPCSNRLRMFQNFFIR